MESGAQPLRMKICPSCSNWRAFTGEADSSSRVNGFTASSFPKRNGYAGNPDPPRQAPPTVWLGHISASVAARRAASGSYSLKKWMYWSRCSYMPPMGRRLSEWNASP